MRALRQTVVVTILSGRALAMGNPPVSEPLQFDIAALKQVDPALIAYQEEAGIPVPGGVPRAIAVTEDGLVVVGTDSAVMALARDGKVRRRVKAPDAISALAAAEDGEVFVGMGSRVAVWRAGATALTPLVTYPGASIVTSIAVLEDGLAVADAGRGIVVLADRAGVEQHRIGPRSADGRSREFKIPSPYFDVVAAQDDSVWVVDPGGHEVRNYGRDGRVRSGWTQRGARIEGFVGCCNPTHVALAPGGKFVTSEKGIERVKVYGPSGEFESVVAAPSSFTPGVTGLDLAVDADGTVFVTDPSAGRIRAFVRKEMP